MGYVKKIKINYFGKLKYPYNAIVLASTSTIKIFQNMRMLHFQ